jgi:hypothetical protein
MAGDDVVQGQLLGALATVLAREAITQEDISPREAAIEVWPSHQTKEADNRWHRHHHARGAKGAPTVLHQLGLAAVQEDQSTAHSANVEGVVVLVEDEHWFAIEAHAIASASMLAEAAAIFQCELKGHPFDGAGNGMRLFENWL